MIERANYDGLRDSGVLESKHGPEPERDRMSINEYLDRLNTEQEQLSEVVGLLEDRLRDILGPERPAKALDGESSPERSPMAHWLDTMVDRQVQLRYRLSALIERVEL